MKNFDFHIQFIGTYMGVEGDSASVSVATAVISAIDGIPVPAGPCHDGFPFGPRGCTAGWWGGHKIEAAVKAGRRLVVRRMNMNDVLIEERYKTS